MSPVEDRGKILGSKNYVSTEGFRGSVRMNVKANLAVDCFKNAITRQDVIIENKGTRCLQKKSEKGEALCKLDLKFANYSVPTINP